jgi:DNA-binding transcriptional LysR family regulator
MELRDIQSFVAVAHELNVSRAAKNAGVRPSTLSRRVSRIEDALGVSMFERHRSGVDLTRAGREFLRAANRALRDLDYAAHRAQNAGKAGIGNLTIGISSSIAEGLAYRAIAGFMALHPDVDVEIAEGAGAAHLQGLRERRLDLALLIGAQHHADLDAVSLWTEWVALAVPEGHALQLRPTIAWRELAGERFIVSVEEPGPEIHDWLMSRLCSPGGRPDVARHAVGRETLMVLVSLGVGLTVVSQAGTSISYPKVAFLPLTDAADRLPFSAVWLPANDNPVLRRFIAVIRSIAEGRSLPTFN